MFKVGDKVTIKASVDPNDKRVGTVKNILDVKVQVDWSNSISCYQTCKCEVYYTANLELYVKPFVVGERVKCKGRNWDTVTVVGVNVPNEEICVHVVDDDGDDMGFYIVHSSEIFHA